MSEATPETLPGFAVTDLSRPSALKEAIQATLEALSELGYVTKVHSSRIALAYTLADVVERKINSGRMSTIGNDARVLMELLDSIVGEADPEGDGGLADTVKKWGETIADLEQAMASRGTGK